MVTNAQLYLAIGVPMLFNVAIIGAVIALMNTRFDALESKFSSKFDSISSQFAAVNSRLDAIDQRFDDMRDLWRAELRRVEEVLDVRLKHIESR